MTSAARAPWWELCLIVPEELADDAAGLLVSEGAMGVEQVVRPKPGEPVLDAARAATVPEGKALLVASYADDATGELLPDTRREQVAELLLELGIEGSADSLGISITERTDSNWAETWKQFWKPTRIGQDVWVVPSWETSFAPPCGAAVLTLDPGMAFGTGQHATTSLCVEQIESYFSSGQGVRPEARPEPRRQERREGVQVLDVGCGSAILAIAAAKLGAASVLAIDNDPEAITVSAENCAKNGVLDRVTVSDADVSTLKSTYELVVANILAVTLIELCHWVLRTVATGGTLLLSGILISQADEVVAAYEAAARESQRKVHGVRRREREEWVVIELQLDRDLA